ncbi:hypothetical protein DACRYDRAFT_71263 [Dacryopinax primogenitus]|uniref:TPR-like protein n=1 Tax=Dacryopinax primogenitus (strain DJM 731) TaxID=1858805 RepID=M5FRD8_DACPD|nr:uncharacterized protein DACRYDRAFT_71263 [Dacryopinax primogenitus]EJT98203.1 hypothetical protein DACRYDRAFT_71263 [Dacryopinax primogenitus]
MSLNPKQAHYEQQLVAALCRGAWADLEPGKSPKAVWLTWNELLRKYKKHNPDSTLATVAVQTQALSLLIARHHPDPPAELLENIPTSIGRKQLDMDGDLEGITGSLDVGRECKLDPSSKQETDGNVEELRGSAEKSQGTESVKMVEVFYAYARGEFDRCLELIGMINLDNPVPPERSQTRTSGGSRSHHGVKLTLTERIESITHVSSAGNLSPPGSILARRALVDPKRAWWIVERIRTRCLEGMACEELKNVSTALRAYEAGISLLEDLGFRKPDNAAQKNEAFSQYRELWRWAERLLWRASVVSSRTSSMSHSLQILRSYHLCSQWWGAAFRPFHRSPAYSLFIRALCFSAPLDTQSNTIRSSAKQSLSAWMAEAKEALLEYRNILQATTVFPRAGQVNTKVVDFADLCMAVWEGGGESEDEAPWISDLMWWGTTLTFHSHRILRHLTRLLVSTGDIDEAKRVFRLYVQLVTKARETSAGDVSLQLKRRPTAEEAAAPEEIALEEGEMEELGAGSDSDGDRTFVAALVFGIRMLSRWAKSEDDAKEAWKMAQLGEGILGELGSPRDRRLQARLKAAAGITRNVQAATEMEPETRPAHQAAAQELLTTSLKLEATADTLYHLAYLQAELRDIDAAVLTAKQAVEKDHREIRAWHLLSLLLTAQGDSNGALAVIKLGLEEVATQQELELIKDVALNPASPQAEGISSRDFAGNDTKSRLSPTVTGLPETGDRLAVVQSPGQSLLDSDSVPRGYTMLKPLIDRKPSKTERFECALQLLITRNTIVELLEGPDSANSNWVDIFAYFSEQCPIPLDRTQSRRHSLDSVPTPLPLALSEPIRTVETLSTVQEVSAMQVPEVITHEPSEPPPEQSNGNTPRPSSEQAKFLQPKPFPLKVNHRQRRDGRDEKRVNLDELRMKSQKLLQGGQKQLQTLSRKIIHRDGQGHRIPRSRSVPDFNKPPPSASVYQASSIHSRVRRYPSPGSMRGSVHGSMRGTISPGRLEPPSPSLVPSEPSGHPGRTQHETRILSELWLMSAATFRRMGQIEQAHGAIQEAEVIDPENPNVWVQLGLYFAAVENTRLAIESFHKALVIDPDHVPASVHLAQQYLGINSADLASGLLMAITQGSGWDVAEAWYFLAKACEKLGRRERERECLVYALRLEESKPIRPLGTTVPRCL